MRDVPLPLEGRVAAKRSGGVADETLDLVFYNLCNMPSTVHDIRFIDSEDDIAKRSQMGIAVYVVALACLSFMEIAIDLDDHFDHWTDEIHDVGTDRRLPPEFQAFACQFTQFIP